MPPPHFSTGTGLPAPQQSSNSTPSLSDLPKQLRAYAREALQNIQTSLVTEDEAILPTASLKAFQSIQKLVDSPELHQSDRESESSKAALSRARVTSGDGTIPPAGASQEGSQALLARHLAIVVNASLFNTFSDDMDQDSHARRQLLIGFIYALRPILDPKCVVLEWWDVLLRPMLKNPHCSVSTSRKAQQIVIWAMSSTPASDYVDEPTPSAVWPPTDQSSAIASWRSERRPGDAPYPASSTRSVSLTPSSEDGDARFSALYSTPSKKAGPADPMRRFTQRIFDLYTSEASSANTKSLDEDDVGDLDDDLDNKHEEAGQKSVAGIDLDMVGPTWKGNLEAIILTFGEERPKPFFHHLSESFLDPAARIPILLLLTIFFRLSSLYVYHVVSTPFVRLLVLSLQLDTSKTSTSLGVLALATLIPHFPNWIANGGAGGLPALLSIYARIVDWRKMLPGWEENSDGSGITLEGVEEMDEEKIKLQHLSKRLQLRKGLEWKRLESTYDTTQSRPDAQKLFTELYGIFPCNLVRFLRAPIDYLRKAEYQSPFQAEWQDIIDENAVQQKSAPIMRRHLLHPALADMDAEREVSDTQRWKEHDTASTAAFCASLYVGNLENASEKAALRLEDVYAEQAKKTEASIVDQGIDSERLDRSIYRRFSRQRSASENLGRSGRVTMQSSLAKAPLMSIRQRDSTKHGDARLPSTWGDRRKQDEFLRNHVALRLDMPLSEPNRIASAPVSSRSGSGVNRPGQAKLTSTLMSPSNSSNLAYQPTSASSPPSPASEAARPYRSDSLSSILSPLERGEHYIQGSPALSAVGSAGGLATKKSKLNYLKQENLHLRNELNYEIGQKDQYLRHIGTVHRNRIKDTVLEEELQNLYQSERSNKIQLKSLKDELEANKAEARQSKNRQASWQADLTARLKAIREEKKAWGNEVRLLKIAKEDRDNLIAKLEGQVEENASELFDLRERVKADTKKVEAIHHYEEKIAQLETCLRLWNDDTQAFEQQNRDMRRLLSRGEEMSMLVEASEGEAEAMRGQLEAVQIDNEALRRKLDEAGILIAQLAKKQTVKTLERVNSPPVSSSPSLWAATGREDGEKIRMKKRIQELEAQLLDSRVREDQWQQHQRPEHQNILYADDEIAPLDLGDAV